MDFTGRTAIVTGAGSGIGKATAIRLSELGANIVSADVNRDAAEKTCTDCTGAALPVQVDVSNSDDVQRLIATTIEHFGRLDILINNAGFGFTGTVETITEDEWDRLMAVNVKGVYLCSRYAMPELAKTGHGAIVNTSSYTAAVGIADRAAYVASKGAVAALTRAMALDHIGQGVRINAVAPGTIDSPYFARMIEASDDPDGLLASLNGRAPVGRMGRASEVAEAIAWLASDSSSLAVGSTLTVDGGTSIW
ncbi:MAG: SDR family oxidoreductase [Rhodococcus sp. (in: high G+C Gram-positive bacteria)]